VKYTKIRLVPPSEYLTEDLWMKTSAPLKIKIAYFINRFSLLIGLIFFILFSCLASFYYLE
jgi:hypothetical protein